MKDRLQLQQLFDASLAAQIAFQRDVDVFKAACDAADLALQAKAAAGQAMAETLIEVDRLTAALAELGTTAPDIVADDGMAEQIRKGRELGKIHAALEAHRPKDNADAN